jgi:hypothetical protein
MIKYVNWFNTLKVIKSKRLLTKRAPDAGDSAQSQAVSYALSFFWLDGFAVPAPAQVTQTVGWLFAKQCRDKDL